MLQNCEAITFRKIANHTKCKQTNVPSHLHIFRLNFDRTNHSLLNLSVLEETDFQKILPEVLNGRLEHQYKCIDSMHFLGM